MDTDAEYYRYKPSIYIYIFSTIFIVFVSVILSSCYCLVVWRLRHRRLWCHVDVNPSRPANVWNNVDVNPPRPVGLYSNFNPNPSRPMGLWSSVNINPSYPERQYSTVNLNPSRPILLTTSPVLLEDARILVDNGHSQPPVGVADAPPDYSVVAGQRPMAADANDNLKRYPRVVETKSETPPPSYLTVVPFK